MMQYLSKAVLLLFLPQLARWEEVNLEESTGLSDTDTDENDSDTTQPIPISTPGSLKTRTASQNPIVAECSNRLPDGTVVEVVENEFGEPMPRVPEVIKPQNSIRDLTTPQGSCRWNPITESWTDFQHNSSRGSWGRFRDQGRLFSQPRDDDFDVRGLFASEAASSAGSSTTSLKEEKRLKITSPPQVTRHRQQSDSVAKREESEAAGQHFDLAELRRLATENEDACESYGSSVGELMMKNIHVQS